MCASRNLIASLLVAILCCQSAVANAATKPATWWIEVVRERALPTAIAESRAAAELKRLEGEAAEKAAAAEIEDEADDKKEEADADDEGAKEKAPVKERVKAMLDKLPAIPKAVVVEGAEKDAKPAAGDAEAKPDEAKEAEQPEEEEEEGPEMLTLTVAMAGEIVGLDNKHLRFRPTVRPDQELTLPLKQVTSLSRHAPGREPDAEEPPDLEFRVVLRDGSEVPGQLMTLTDKAITVALVGSGAKIDLPLSEITRVERNEPVGDAVNGTLPNAPDRHVAALSTGEVVAGQLLASRDSDRWLRISSPILTAEAPLSLIDLLVFPDPEAAAAGRAEEALADELVAEDEGNNAVPAEPVVLPVEPLQPEPAKPDIRHLVSLSPAGMLWAKNLKLDGDNLLISALGKDEFAVPINRVASVSFGHEGLNSSAPILIWGGFSDEDDEYKKTIDALDDHIPPRKLLQNRSKIPDADFMRQLRRSRVLLVPEMESFKKTEIEEAAKKAGKAIPTWADTFKGFLRRGGNIVFLSPTGEALNFFNSSGLGPLRSGGSGDKWQFTAEGRKAVGAKVGGPVDNVNATHYYRKGAPWEAWGQAAAGGDGVTLVGRRLDRGWVMVFGTDFYETNPDVTETLVKLLEFRGRR